MTPRLQKPLFRLHVSRYVFTPKLIPTVFFLLLLALLLHLGFWQLRRARYKHMVITQMQLHQTKAPLQLKDVQSDTHKLAYYPIRVTGHYDNQHQLLLDNKIYNHAVGFEVITPFIPLVQSNKHASNSRHQSNKVILVNRGWIPQGRSRQDIPNIPSITHSLTLTGTINTPSKNIFVLSNKQQPITWPLIIQTIDLNTIQTALDKPVYPFLLKLSAHDQTSFASSSQPILIKPQKHIGYAVQWFALALTLVIIYLSLNIHRQ